MRIALQRCKRRDDSNTPETDWVRQERTRQPLPVNLPPPPPPKNKQTLFCLFAQSPPRLTKKKPPNTVYLIHGSSAAGRTNKVQIDKRCVVALHPQNTLSNPCLQSMSAIAAAAAASSLLEATVAGLEGSKFSTGSASKSGSRSTSSPRLAPAPAPLAPPPSMSPDGAPPSASPTITKP